MPRPSRHLDRALLAAGRELYPAYGCAGLTIRQIAEAAGVNIGMFHYHFRTREAFLRAVMHHAYEEMFLQLNFVTERQASFHAMLRAALRVLGRFLLGNGDLVGRILADALGGESVAREFLKGALPRHLHVLLGLVAAGQTAGEFRPMSPSQALAFCAGALSLPMLVGGAMVVRDGPGMAIASELRATILDEQALDERIDLVLEALAIPAALRS